MIRRRPAAWWGLVAGAALVGIFLLALDPISDGDIFWHLAAGRELIRRGAWLRTDPFTSSAAGRPWIDVHWLFQLASLGAFRMGGFAGVVIGKAVIVTAGAGVLFRIVWRTEGWAGLAATALSLLATLFCGRHLLLVRPVVVTLLMLALFVSVLETSRREKNRVFLLIGLPLLQVVWINCQGMAVLGIAVVGSYAVAAALSSTRFARGRRWPFLLEAELPLKTLVAASGLCAVATLVNPYGWRALVLSTELLTRVVPAGQNVFSQQVAENLPPWVVVRGDPAAGMQLAWVLGAMAAALFIAAREKLALSRTLVLGGMLVLALMATRNVLLLYWVGPPLVALELAPALRLAAARFVSVHGRDSIVWMGRMPPIILTLALAGEVMMAAVARANEGAIAEPVPFHFPTESAAILRARGASGAIFAPDHQGGYLEWTVPDLRPYIDTRLVLHTASEYAAYLHVVDHPEDFDAFAEREGFRYVVLTTSYPDRYLALAQHLRQNPDWRLAFTDGSEILFAREGASQVVDSPGAAMELLQPLAQRFSGSEAQHTTARLNLARLFMVWGQSREAHTVLATLGSRAAAQLRARAYLVGGEARAAEALSLILLESDPQDVRTLALLAQIAIARGRDAASVDWLKQALAAAPHDPEALGLLHALEEADPVIH